MCVSGVERTGGAPGSEGILDTVHFGFRLVILDIGRIRNL